MQADRQTECSQCRAWVDEYVRQHAPTIAAGVWAYSGQECGSYDPVKDGIDDAEKIAWRVLPACQHVDIEMEVIRI